MGTTQHFSILSEALVSEKRTMTEQFGNIVYGLSRLAAHQKLQTDDALKQRLQRLIGAWTGRDDGAELEVTLTDVGDAKALLSVFDQKVIISDPDKVDLRTLRWGDQLRFGTAAVLAASYQPGEVEKLLAHQLHGTRLLDLVYAHVCELHSGVTVTDFSEVVVTNRAIIHPLVTQLQALLDNPVYAVSSLLVDDANSIETKVFDLRLATVAALSRLALLESKSA